MKRKIGKNPLKGQIHILSSKSDGHRALIASALADRESLLMMEGWSADMEATARCLAALGAKITKEGFGIRVSPIADTASGKAVLDCGESASALRFLLPVAGALGRDALFEGHGRLPERPIGILLEEMEQHGCSVTGRKLPLALSGRLCGGRYTLPGNISSQFITGLLFALPLLKKNSEIRLTTHIESASYINMTLQMLERFGICVEKNEANFQVYGGQTYRSPGRLAIQGDWSNAAFWLTAGAISGSITCHGLDSRSVQGDKAILPLLEKFGAKISINGNTVTASSGALRGCRIDASQIPDLAPILCIAAAAAEGRTEIYNAGRLRIKESDRLSAMASCLQKIGVSVQERPDGLVITGGISRPKQPVTLSSYDDHRIVMAMAIAAASLGVEMVIEGTEAVDKSYPSFFEEFIKLGGAADVL